MQPKHVMALLLGSFILASFNLREELRVFKIVTKKEITTALNQSSGKKVLLNIYPVKLSADMAKEDFALRIAFQDAGASHQKMGGDFNSKLFKIQSAWYVQYLKQHALAADQIPYGYFIELDQAMINQTNGINIAVLPEQSKMEYCLLPPSFEPAAPLSNPADPNPANSCPPNCCSAFRANLIQIDSIGKCPPDCKKFKLLLEPTMKKVISKQFP